VTVGGKTVGAIGAGAPRRLAVHLYADTRKGNRPSFTDVAPPEQGEDLYRAYLDALRAEGVRVAPGAFGANMRVSLVNDGQ
jgi:D-tyrosyl-tRNA(Tyr) deacylase